MSGTEVCGTFPAVVASQLLADDPPGTWQAVPWLSALGYDWHNVMHMIAVVVSDDLYRAGQEHRQFDSGDYARRLAFHRGPSARIGRGP